MAIPMPTCRICGAAALEPILSLGDMPPVNSFLAGPKEVAGEKKYPLAISFCPGCTHVQLTHRLDPQDVFVDYIYFSSMSKTVVDWGKTLAERYRKELEITGDDLVVEVASNDGCILKAFRTHCRVLGVEPAKNIAEVANRDGIPTHVDFFSFQLARRLREQHRPTRLIIARNVLAHVPEVVDFVRGAASWLADDGILHIEVPYLRAMVEHLEFDTIYHEHLSYFSVTALERLCREAGMVLWDVEEILLHGGSLIARARRAGPPRDSVARYLAQEKQAGYTGSGPLHRFAQGTRQLKSAVPEFLTALAKEGPLAAYGAAAKGVVLTNYCGLGTRVLPWVADRSTYKQGKLLPGVHIPVVPPERVLAEKPAHLVILAWNFVEEIAEQLDAYRQGGGRFVVPVPVPGVRP